MYTTFGAPSGAFGGSNGAQSGSESRMSTLMTPLNGSLMCHHSLLGASPSVCALRLDYGCHLLAGGERRLVLVGFQALRSERDDLLGGTLDL